MRRHARAALSLAVLALTPPAQAEQIWHVNAAAPPGGDGRRWDTAFDSVQSALDKVKLFDQIWIAAGRYHPVERLDPADARSATFHIPSGISVYGGFAGNETSLEQRAGLFDETVLSGDLGVPGNSSDNAYHVVHLSQTLGIPPRTVIDGFVIRAGKANGPTLQFRRGGGIYTFNTDLVLSNCAVRDNYGAVGGGIYQVLGRILSAWCTFEDNRSARGGALHARYAAASLYNARFQGNTAILEGGAVYVHSTSTATTPAPFVVTSSVFHDNHADRGGAVYLRVATQSNALPTNTSWIHCTFAYNTASEGGGAFVVEPATLWSSSEVFSSILWANAAPLGPEVLGSPKIRQSTVAGGYVGPGNLALDPLFADGPNRDLSLQPVSPCIDAGNKAATPLDLADLDGDKVYAELAPLDLERRPRFAGYPWAPNVGVGVPPLVDMGAHEVQSDVVE